MSYRELSMTRVPPKMTKAEIDAVYFEERNNGRHYVTTLNGPQHISDWREEMYRKHGIDAALKD